MQIHQKVNSKVGSKVTSYKDDIIHKNLSSMMKTNSHDYPEIKINSS